MCWFSIVSVSVYRACIRHIRTDEKVLSKLYICFSSIVSQLIPVS